MVCRAWWEDFCNVAGVSPLGPCDKICKTKPPAGDTRDGQVAVVCARARSHLEDHRRGGRKVPWPLYVHRHVSR